MKKLFLSVCLLAFLFCNTTASTAEQFIPVELLPAAETSLRTDEYFPVQPIYRLITYKYATDSLATDFQSMLRSVCVGHVTYCYTVTWGTNHHQFHGGSVDYIDYPRCSAISDPALNVQMTVADHPTANGVVATPDGIGYQVTIGGGALSVTYNDIIVYDFNMNILETHRTTDLIPFAYQHTAPLGE